MDKNSDSEIDDANDFIDDDDEIIREDMGEDELKKSPSENERKELSINKNLQKKPDNKSKPKNKKENDNEKGKKIPSEQEIIREEKMSLPVEENNEAVALDESEVDILEVIDDDEIFRERVDNDEDEVDDKTNLKELAGLAGGKKADDITQLREYQYEIYNNSCEKNGILYLETGAGKTIIAMMLINYYSMKYPKKQVFNYCYIYFHVVEWPIGNIINLKINNLHKEIKLNFSIFYNYRYKWIFFKFMKPFFRKFI